MKKVLTSGKIQGKKEKKKELIIMDNAKSIRKGKQIK
jgi:hypothetical protein